MGCITFMLTSCTSRVPLKKYVPSAFLVLCGMVIILTSSSGQWFTPRSRSGYSKTLVTDAEWATLISRGAISTRINGEVSNGTTPLVPLEQVNVTMVHQSTNLTLLGRVTEEMRNTRDDENRGLQSHEGTAPSFGHGSSNSTLHRAITEIFHPDPNIPEKLMRVRPKILQDYPSTFLDDYKNPCYRKKTDEKLHCLPYFFLLGTPKSGTSDIWSKITSHPDIVYGIKEPHWWTRFSCPTTNKSSAYASLDPYERYVMTGPIEKQTTGENATRRASVVTGDGSASTFWDNRMWETFFPEDYTTGPPYIMADVIHTVLPNAKLIVTLRDPIDRLYSEYWYFHRSNTMSEEDFHEGVVRRITEFETCVTKRSQRACAYSTHKNVRLHIGLYSIYTYDWLQRYPRDQFLALKLEEWKQNCTSLLPMIYQFLNVAKLPSSVIAKICRAPSKNVGKQKRHSGQMWSSTRELLRDFYRPYVKDLATLLEDKKFMWDYHLTDMDHPSTR